LRWVLIAVGSLALAAVLGLAIGPVFLPPGSVALELLSALPLVPDLHSGLTRSEAAIVTQIRLPRVVLAMLVGATLAMAGGCYQGVFRNPLADPYLLGVAAGAGLGATFGITYLRGPFVTVFAFAGALLAVALTYGMGAAGNRHRAPATLILAGVAVSSFLTACQTFLQQRHVDTIREVFSWILGRLATDGWSEVRLLLPYAIGTGLVMLAAGRSLDVLAVGDEEASALGANPQRTRILLIVAASLGTAAAVAVSGLIGFVGIIVPHTIRLLFGASHRIILPLSALFGAAFLVLADLVGRTALAPAEMPIGVVTAFFGAPFFVLVLRTSRRSTL
jgi:iron complex transport system permease protein